MKTISLGGDKCALVDDEDYEFLSLFSWHANQDGYAQATILMHRLVMRTPRGLTTDHLNKKRADNQHSNLEVCGFIENMRRRRPHCKTSVYFGVSNIREGKWRAKMTYHGRRLHLGNFPEERWAAMASDMWQLVLRPENPTINFTSICSRT